MIRRPRVAVVAAVALLGVLAGGLLVSVVAPAPSPLPKVDRTPVRPAALAERPLAPSPVLRGPSLPSPEDTGGEPLSETAAPAPPPEPDPAGALPMGSVTCTVIGETTDLEIRLMPSLDIIDDLADQLSAAMDEGRGEAEVAAVTATRRAFGGDVPWSRRGDELTFEAVVGSPSATFTVQRAGDDGSEERVERDATLQWDAGGGSCVGIVDFTTDPFVEISGRVVGLLEGERSWVSVCGSTIPVGFTTSAEPLADDEFRAEISRHADAPCAVTASRRDGTLTATSTPVYVDPADGDITGLVLVLPEGRIGGIGVPVGPHPDGMIVQAPTPGSPAERAGLEEGDVVVAVDGEPLAGLDVYESIHLVTGPVGSTVELTVQLPGGDRQTVVVERQAIE